MFAPPDPDEEFARWLAAHPQARLLAIAAFFARRGHPTLPSTTSALSTAPVRRSTPSAITLLPL